jgi:hypothetical protein
MSEEKENNVVEFIPREEYERTLEIHGTRIEENGKARLPREFNRRRVVESFMDAFELVGGTPRLAQWASSSDENYGKFAALWARLLPSQASTELAQANEKVVKMVLPRSTLDE